MRYQPRFCLCLSLLLSTIAGFPQTNVTGIDNIAEPHELTGQPRPAPPQPTQAERDLFDITGHLNNEQEMRSVMGALDNFLTKYPRYSDAYFLRAQIKACVLGSSNLSSIADDVHMAISQPGGQVYNETNYYSLLGKIAMQEGRHRTARRPTVEEWSQRATG